MIAPPKLKGLSRRVKRGYTPVPWDGKIVDSEGQLWQPSEQETVSRLRIGGHDEAMQDQIIANLRRQIRILKEQL